MLRSLVLEAASKKTLASASHLIKRSISVTVANFTEKKVNDDKTRPKPAAEPSDLGDKSKRTIRLHASVCIERMPVITCEMNDLEKRYSNLINQINVRKSLLSNHELRHKRDLWVLISGSRAHSLQSHLILWCKFVGKKRQSAPKRETSRRKLIWPLKQLLTLKTRRRRSWRCSSLANA